MTTQPKWGEVVPEKVGWYWVRSKSEPAHPAKVFMSKAGLLCFISSEGPKASCDFHRYQWAECMEPVE
ncbi:MAG: hypothetical protein OSJ28_04585 [Desulfovibrio sp.]|nr:hypothetical protein [Desulfovibrio sp.]